MRLCGRSVCLVGVAEFVKCGSKISLVIGDDLADRKCLVVVIKP